ncbi:uncharacterized protein LOC117639038 [Thrips palmi]|uniref:Uncharacterized protein LOC117639038 n=1 Tax=Thrips palmi TaxID=161013 RepID=A0A6P8Y987_THRPL|nr:uncharacterized protein LOC117639038 [Thrips palmi]
MRAAWRLVAVVAALAVAAQATDLEDKVAKTIAEFKDMMSTGRPDLNIPVLEPLSIKKIPISINASPFKANLEASAIKVVGASSFQVTELTQVGDSSQMKVAIEVPGIEVTGDYDIHGQVKVGFIKVNLNGKGPLTISAKGIKGSGVAEVVPRGNSLHLNAIKINSWSWDKLTINLANLLDNGVMSKTVNKLINKLVPAFASANNSKLTALLETVAKKYINKYLDGIVSDVAMLDSQVNWIVSEEVQEILDQLAAAVTAPTADEPSDLETAVKELSEVFRIAMKKGRPDLNIAAMDPAVFSELNIHFHKWLLDGQAVATDLQVSGASDFELTKVTALDDTNVAIEFSVPSITAATQYDLDAKVNLGLTKLHSVRSGSVGIVAGGIKGAATAELVVDKDGQLRLDAFEITKWSYDTLTVELENPENAGFIKKNVNKLIGKLVPSLLVKPHTKDLTAWASSRGFSIIGRFLDGVAGRIPLAGLDARATELLLNLQTVMKTGSTDYDLPVLDPFILNELPFSFEGYFVKASVVAKNLQVGGTSAFTITKISQIPDSNKIQVDLEVPEINGNSDFTAKAGLKWPTKTVTDNGSLTALIRGLKVSATARLAENAEGALLLKDLNIDSWTFDQIAVEFANLHDSHVGSVLNAAINDVLPTIVAAQKNVINSWAEVTAKAVLDQYLAGVAKASSSLTVDIKVIPAEARHIIMQLAALAA